MLIVRSKNSRKVLQNPFTIHHEVGAIMYISFFFFCRVHSHRSYSINLNSGISTSMFINFIVASHLIQSLILFFFSWLQNQF